MPDPVKVPRTLRGLNTQVLKDHISNIIETSRENIEFWEHVSNCRNCITRFETIREHVFNSK
jgi:hypothetical protein